MTTIVELKSDPSLSKTMPLDKLKELFEQANQAYYESGTPLFSDEIFDIITEILVQRDPKAAKHLFNLNVKAQKTVNLKYWMGSQDKIRNKKEIENWLKKYLGPEFFESEKLDGLSFLYDNGKLFTRGNGTMGNDISHILPFVVFNNNNRQDYPIVGEMIIPKELFKGVKGYSSARATVSGLVHASKPKKSLLKKVHLVAFAIPNSDLSPSKQFAKLKADGYEVPAHWSVTKDEVNFDKLEKRFTSQRKKSKYDIDGIVVAEDKPFKRATSGNPKYSFAFKTVLQDQMAETVVEKVLWNMSRRKEWKPTVQYKEVTIANIKNTKATGHNAKQVFDKGIGPGAKILVIRSGDVIPYIYKVLKRAKNPSLPPKSTTTTEAKQAVQLKEHVYFFETLGIKGVKGGSLKKLGAEKLTLLELLSLPKTAWTDALGKKGGPKAYKAVHDGLSKGITLVQAMVGSACFDSGVGTRVLNSVLGSLPNLPTLKANLKEKLLEVPGIQEITADKIIAGLAKFKDWQKVHKGVIKVAKKHKAPAVVKNGKLTGQVFAFTGFRDDALKEKITNAGGEVASSLTKKVTTLIVKDKSSKSSKMKKAEGWGIAVVAKDDFKV
jgi:DNA ligase (NAD+)